MKPFFAFFTKALQTRDGRTDRPTDRPTDRRTDGPTDTRSYRDARTHLKSVEDDMKLGSENRSSPIGFDGKVVSNQIKRISILHFIILKK